MSSVSFARVGPGGEFSGFGIGKIIGTESNVFLVSFFDNPTKQNLEVEIPKQDLRPINLAPQTRVYWNDLDRGVWRVGRVLHHREDMVGIRFPNGNDTYKSPNEIQVRWEIPIDDPSPYLAQKFNESSFFYDARSRFIDTIFKQRAACQGMSSVLSSSIELEPHQLEVVRRVLHDPVQRYLLADEVGLGKTIEAGAIIRQYVIDFPSDHKVVVVVPSALRSQWRSELVGRFGLNVQIDITVSVVEFDDLDTLEEELQGCGMLVIDEAHHLNEEPKIYETISAFSEKIPRLLLLSATPVLGNEEGFLRILHLIDPIVFPLDSVDAFRNMISNRQSTAILLASLAPENMLEMHANIEELVETFPDDDLLLEYSTGLRQVCDRFPEEDDFEFLEAISTLRSHISETYKLDRRILRNRRSQVIGLTPPRVGVEIVQYSSRHAADFYTTLEDWRISRSLDLFEDQESKVALDESEWFSRLLAMLLTQRDGIDEVLEMYPGDPETMESDLWYRLGDLALGLPEVEFRTAALVPLINSSESDRKWVVFCSDSAVADLVTEKLSSLVPVPVLRQNDMEIDDEGEEIYSAFSDNNQIEVLICDATAEEGINLQGGKKTIVHFDLPLSPGRIEQRTGRLDRFGTGNPINSVVIVCSDNPWEVACANLMDIGFSVFRQSIASLQYLIYELVSTLEKRLLVEGYEAISDLTGRLAGENGVVLEELRKIRQQEALDALGDPQSVDFDELFDVDGNWRDIQSGMEDWLHSVLQIGKGAFELSNKPQDETVCRYRMSYGTGRETLIPFDSFVRRFAQDLDVDAPDSSSKNPLTFPHCYRRQTTVTNRARSAHIRMSRFGSAFIDSVLDLARIDDRGRSFALWRTVPDYSPLEEADVFVRFDFIMETDVSLAERVLREAGRFEQGVKNALSRRADGFLAPFYERLWLDGELDVVDDESVLALLDADYKTIYADQTLNWTQWQKIEGYEVTCLDNWEEFVAEARRVAGEKICVKASLHERSETAVNRARLANDVRLARLRARISKLDGLLKLREQTELDLETRVSESLYSGMSDPSLSLDTIGVIFLSDIPLV